MIGSALVAFCVGWWALYHWLRQMTADICWVVWLVLWLSLLWPLVYRTVWRIRVKKP